MNALTYHRGVTHAGKSGETLVSGIACDWRKAMASWVKCTMIEDGTEVRLNMDHVALVRPHHRDRGGVGAIRSSQCG